VGIAQSRVGCRLPGLVQAAEGRAATPPKSRRRKGIVLPEGAFFQGTAGFGSCDRSGYLLWRKE